MSPNAPVPPPPPPPGGVPGQTVGRDDAQSTVVFSAGVPGAQPGTPPSFSPSSGETSQVHLQRATPADGQPTVVASAAAFQHTTIQNVTPITQLPTAAQPVVPAPAAVPPQRVRYATEQGGFGVAAPVGTAASRPAYAEPATGYAAPPAYASAGAPGGGYQPAAQQPAYHPPAAAQAPAADPAPEPRPAGGGSGSSRPASRSGSAGGSGGGGGVGRLSPGWIAFIVVDALLVIGAIVFAISLAGGGEDEPAAPVASSPSATATEETEEATPEPTVTETFASESRNITCEVTDVSATCVIAQLGTQPAAVSGCEGTVGYKVVLDADGSVEQPCVPTAEQPQAAAGGVEVLAYGQSRTIGPFTCESAETGMTCRDDATGKGFTIARAGIRPL